jgi:hypothetical protein
MEKIGQISVKNRTKKILDGLSDWVALDGRGHRCRHPASRPIHGRMDRVKGSRWTEGIAIGAQRLFFVSQYLDEQTELTGGAGC